jgi:hypothetical protein
LPAVVVVVAAEVVAEVSSPQHRWARVEEAVVCHQMIV